MLQTKILICYSLNYLNPNNDVTQPTIFYQPYGTLIFEAAEFKLISNGPRNIKYRTIYLSVNQCIRLETVLKRKSFKFNKTELPCLCYTKHVLFNTTDPLRLTTCLSLSLLITLSLSLYISPPLYQFSSQAFLQNCSTIHMPIVTYANTLYLSLPFTSFCWCLYL